MDGPRKLGTFGASYLYAIFIAVGVLQTPMLEAIGASNGNMRGCREMDMPPPLPNDANDAIADNIVRPHNHSLRSTCIFPLSVYNGIQENDKGESDMPRGVKGSGKESAEKKEVQKKMCIRDSAWGWEPVTVDIIKQYRPATSLSLIHI